METRTEGVRTEEKERGGAKKTGTVLRVGPVPRIEGHLDLEVTLETSGGVQTVSSARSSGTMFRGFEQILKGRDPRDATHYTQRICGVCPVSHGMASVMALEAAYNVEAPPNGRILRNLVLGADYLMSHVLHFYHLAAPDYIDTTGLLDMSPWTPRPLSADMITGSTAATLVGHYVEALAIRRKAHEMGAIFGGKMPCSPVFLPGGTTEVATADKIVQFRALLDQVRTFVRDVNIPDAYALGGAFHDYFSIGRGCGNLLAYGVFDLTANGSSKLLARGRLTDGTLSSVDPAAIREYVKYSWYENSNGNRNPSAGETKPAANKKGAYSWIKAPRYQGKAHEVGALARMWINGDYRNGISVMDRIVARAMEAQKIGDAMDGWLDELVPGQPSYTGKGTPVTATGIGLSEAPRGAVGHWVQISNSTIGRYQVVSPTSWNASPRDDSGQAGAIEQALTGVTVADPANPVELLRIVHSFDPCLSCSVHVARADGRRARLEAVTL